MSDFPNFSTIQKPSNVALEYSTSPCLKPFSLSACYLSDGTSLNLRQGLNLKRSGTWNVTPLVGKEPEIVREVERYRLEIVGLTSKHSLKALEPSSLRGAGPSTTLELPLRVSGGWDRSLAVVCVYGPNSSIEYPAFLESLGGVLDSAPTGDSIVLLGDFNAHVGNDSDNLEGRDWEEQPPQSLNPSGVLLLDFLC
ncbi:hypothetical protein L3Q82_007390 [Scortum barcoo]|uniref:Uncharacterized protein n=1 Tax=Scortum barcoo TaxID=214431 RepID=A0ACB8WTW0_9TELE|nr:hypothetical protein L3Q82_007390 [Scortum barcoo]